MILVCCHNISKSTKKPEVSLKIPAMSISLNTLCLFWSKLQPLSCLKPNIAGQKDLYQTPLYYISRGLFILHSWISYRSHIWRYLKPGWGLMQHKPKKLIQWLMSDLLYYWIFKKINHWVVWPCMSICHEEIMKSNNHVDESSRLFFVIRFAADVKQCPCFLDTHKGSEHWAHYSLALCKCINNAAVVVRLWAGHI